MIERIAAKIDPRLHDISGKVFYSGRSAFSCRGGIYVMGFNPGGDPIANANETVGSHTDYVLSEAPAEWSAYADEVWPGNGPTMQRRMQHLFKALNCDPRLVPSSNLIFSRSRRSADLRLETSELIDLCWPVHEAVLRYLEPKAVICLGADSAKQVRSRTQAVQPMGCFHERNARRWESSAWQSSSGLLVFQLTHPSIADWTKAETDPSPMVKSILLEH